MTTILRSFYKIIYLMILKKTINTKKDGYHMFLYTTQSHEWQVTGHCHIILIYNQIYKLGYDAADRIPHKLAELRWIRIYPS